MILQVWCPNPVVISCFLLCYFSTDVGSPSDVTVCLGKIATTTCHFDANNRVIPHWRILNESGLLFSVNANDSEYGFFYPSPGKNDSEANLIVPGDQMFDGCHVECRLALTDSIDSPTPGTIKVIGMFQLYCNYANH